MDTEKTVDYKIPSLDDKIDQSFQEPQLLQRKLEVIRQKEKKWRLKSSSPSFTQLTWTFTTKKKRNFLFDCWETRHNQNKRKSKQRLPLHCLDDWFWSSFQEKSKCFWLVAEKTSVNKASQNEDWNHNYLTQTIN